MDRLHYRGGGEAAAEGDPTAETAVKSQSRRVGWDSSTGIENHMTSTVKFRIAEALFPLLPMFHEVDGALLEGVTQVASHGTAVKITLHLGSKFLVIRAVEKDDTVELSIGGDLGRGETISHMQPWSRLVGKQIGWGWVMVNQQGYLDGVLLSFGGVSPELVITVVASALKVRSVI